MKKFKIFIDIILTILFLILMGYHIVGDELHEILGTSTFLVFLLHNFLNIKWYKTILKGKHNLTRVFHITINIALLIAMICSMISGILISGHLFTFLGISTTMFARGFHMVSTSWCYILMAIHVGIHLSIKLTQWNRRLKNHTLEYVNYLGQLLLIAYGVFAFYHQKLVSDLFLMSHFKFFDYEQSPILFYLEFIAILLGISIIVHYLLVLMRKGGKKE